MSKFLKFIKKYDILILLILGIILYFPSFFYNFVYDDIPFIVNNQYINGNIPINLFDFFIPKFVRDDIYIPFTFILYSGIIKIFGISSFAFHFFNIVFYISSSIALFYLLKKIIRSYYLSFFAVILYILHPCHIECTAWIAAMGYNVAMLFFCLSCLYFISAFDEDKKINYLYSVLFYVLAILSQPIAVTLPAILFLWVYCFRKERLKESIKYICAYIPFLLFYLYLYKQTVLRTDRFLSIKYNIFDRFSTLGFDLLNSFFPVNLCIIKPNPSLFFLIPLVLFFVFCFFFRENKRYLFFVGFEIITILPYSNIFFPIEVANSERYLLLSSVSSCVLISYLSFYILKIFKKQILLKYISFIFFIILYFLSFTLYLPVWKNDRTFWVYAYNVNPDNINVDRAYSKILLEDKKYDEALILVDRMIEKHPTNFDAYGLKVIILMNKNRTSEAIELCHKMENLFPKEFKTNLYFFDIYMALKDYDKALDSFKMAEEKCKKSNLYNNNNLYIFTTKRIKLNYILAQSDEFIESLKLISNNFVLLQDNGKFSKILEKKDYKSREEICLDYLKKYSDKYSQSLIFLLSCLYMQETYKENASTIMKSLLEEMDKAENFLKTGDNNSAEKIYLSVISKNEYMYEAYYNLGSLYLQTNRPDEAKKIFGKILEINPNDDQIKQIYFSL